MNIDPAMEALIERAKKVLDRNSRKTFTVPSEGLYPHQVLWDSCFIAIGKAHYDIKRAKSEILQLLHAQWQNGMVPHIIFSEGYHYWWDRRIWRSWTSPLAPAGVSTSGISQPPMLTEAAVRIGKKLSKSEQVEWYKSVFPHLLAYHKWLYAERRTDESGLLTQVHPWETGLDNTPPAITILHQTKWPWWLKFLDRSRLDTLGNYFRFDRRFVPASQRSSNIEALALYSLLRHLRSHRYESTGLLSTPLFAIQDLTYNSITVRANSLLLDIAHTIGEEIPEALRGQMAQTATAIETLWDEHTDQYFSRNPLTSELIREPTIATFLPLYGGSISQSHAQTLVRHMSDEFSFGTDYPLPSVPLNSRWFRPKKYWQGPTWINTNWLIIDGLRRYNFHREADHLTKKTVEVIQENGFFEYFDTRDGTGAGTDNFSWTAALILDLLDANS